MMNRIILAFLLALTLSGCMGSGEKEKPEHAAGGEYGAPGTEIFENDSLVLKKDAGDDLGTFDDFSFDLIAAVLSQAHENTIVSPLSCGFALGMLLAGAQGDTAAVLGSVFSNKGESANKIIESLNHAERFLTRLDTQVEMVFANSMWYSDKLRIKKGFQTDLERNFDARIQALNFSDTASIGMINAWVGKKTGNRISNLIDSIGADQVAFLINALYFKGHWTHSFDEKRTRQMDFFLDDGASILTPMMRAVGMPYLYMKSDAADVLSLPYGNKGNETGGLDFVILLPREGLTTESFMSEMTMNKMSALLRDQAEVTYDLLIPKFRLESELVLNDTLSKKGLGTIFSDGADFSAMLDSSGRFSIDFIKQKCFVEVNEKGTEAAAATAAGIKATSVSKDPVIIVNRPFVFVIRERSTGIILFAGVVKHPVTE